MSKNNQSAFPYVFENKDVTIIEHGMTLRDYAQIKFMSAVISNSDTMREITRVWKNTEKCNRTEFEDTIAKLGGVYADAMLKEREQQNK